MSDPSAGSHPAWPALEKGALWDHDPRLQAAWKHYSVCRHEHPRRQRDRRLHAHRSEEHTSELQSLRQLVCRLLLEKKNRDVANGMGAAVAGGRAKSGLETGP